MVEGLYIDRWIIGEHTLYMYVGSFMYVANTFEELDNNMISHIWSIVMVPIIGSIEWGIISEVWYANVNG